MFNSKLGIHSANEQLNTKWIEPKRLCLSVTHNQVCDICFGVVAAINKNASDSLLCIYCTVSIHLSCWISQTGESKEHTPNSWICYHCIESLDHSRRHYVKKKKIASKFKKMSKASIIIQKYWRRAREMKRFNKIYSLIKRLQQWVRRIKTKAAFSAKKLERLRPIKIIIHSCDNVSLRGAECASNSRSQANKVTEITYSVLITVVEIEDGAISQKWHSALKCGSIVTGWKGDNKVITANVHTEHLLAGTALQQQQTFTLIKTINYRYHIENKL